MAGQVSRVDHIEYYSEKAGAAAAHFLPQLPSPKASAIEEGNALKGEDNALKVYLQNGFSSLKAETLLRGRVPSAFQGDPDGVWSFRSIGMPEDNQKEECVSGFAAGLLNIPGPFSIQLVKLPDRIPQFRILTAPENGTAVHGLLRSVFGQAEMKKVEEENRAFKDHTFEHSVSASLTRRFETEGRGGAQKETPPVNWPMRVLLSGVRGSYQIQMNLAPVSEDTLREYFKSLCDVYGVCALASSPSSQISGSRSNNLNVVGNLADQVMESTRVNEKLTTSDSVSQSRSFSGRELVPELYQAQLKQLALKNQEAIDTGGWTVEIHAFSDKLDTLRMLEAVLAGAFTDTPFQVRWQEEDTQYEKEALWIARSDAEYFIQAPNDNFPGFERRKNYKLSLCPPYESPKFPLDLGTILWNNEETDLPFVLPAMAYNRHAFVCGMTGAGKTNTIFHHLKQMKLPFLVIEPVKSEYHELSGSIPQLKTWNMNPASRSVLRINPFWFPRGGSLTYHMGSLKTIISSAFVLYSAMPNILEQCLTRVYIRCGWNIASGTNAYDGILPERYLYPNFSMLCEEIDQFLLESKYTGETLSTYQGALLTRLKVFASGTKGILFDTAEHPDYDLWRQQPVIVELDELSDDADKCIALGVLTLQYFEVVRLAQKKEQENPLRHLFVIEEAHRLFKRTESGSSDPESASPEQQLVETLSNMMAEIRAYGEGMFIVDQSPAKVAEDVIRNSSVKLIHRLDNLRDIEVIESSLRMQDASGLIAALMPGQALVSAEKMSHAALIRIPQEKDNEGETAPTAPESSEDTPNDTLINFVQADAALDLAQVSAEMLRLADRFITSMLYDILTLDKLTDFSNLFLRQTQEIILTYASGARDYINKADFLSRLMFRSLEKQLAIRFAESAALAFKSAMLFEQCIRLAAEGELTASDVSVIDQYRSIQIWDEMRQQFSISRIPAYSLIRQVLRGRQAQAYWEIIRFFVVNKNNKKLFVKKNLDERQKVLLQGLDRQTMQRLEGVVMEAIVRDALDVADALYGKVD